MSSGNNREGMRAWFILAEWEFGTEWNPCSERNNAKGPRVSCESSSPTQQHLWELHRDSGPMPDILWSLGSTQGHQLQALRSFHKMGVWYPNMPLDASPNPFWNVVPASQHHWGTSEISPAQGKINLEVLSRKVLGKDVGNDAGEGSSSRDVGVCGKWPPLPGPSASHRSLSVTQLLPAWWYLQVVHPLYTG